MFDVLIAGGGPAGCATAAALSDLGLSVLLADAGVDRSKQLAGELLHPSGVEDLRALGLGAVIDGTHVPRVRGFAVMDSDGATHRTVVLPYAQEEHGVTFEHAAFAGSLLEAIGARVGVTVARARVTDVRRNDAAGVEVVLTGEGTTRLVQARLLVAADGRGSLVRKLLGIRDHHERMSTMLGLTVDARHLPHEGHGHLFIGGPAPVLGYAIGHGVARILVDLPLGSRPQRVRDAETLQGLPENLRAAVLSALEAQPSRMASNDTRLPETISLGSAVLVGDAAGCAHPLSASGMAFSTRDARVLQAVLRETDGNVQKALPIYGRRRRPAQRTRLSLASALYRAFTDRSAEMQALRVGLFDYWSRSSDGARASMALLSGRETRTWSMAREYARVVGYGAASLLSEGLRPGGRKLEELVGAGAGLVASAWPHVRSAVRGQVEAAGQRLKLPLETPSAGELSVGEARAPERSRPSSS